ncbi:Uncharacterised protein [Mycobacteroides abscessus subsp. massiliense]|nr:Uncharacterised protein [Mycobacteroides abscessus subsp. massiliense]
MNSNDVEEGLEVQHAAEGSGGGKGYVPDEQAEACGVGGAGAQPIAGIRTQ